MNKNPIPPKGYSAYDSSCKSSICRFKLISTDKSETIRYKCINKNCNKIKIPGVENKKMILNKDKNKLIQNKKITIKF